MTGESASGAMAKSNDDDGQLPLGEREEGQDLLGDRMAV